VAASSRAFRFREDFFGHFSRLLGSRIVGGIGRAGLSRKESDNTLKRITIAESPGVARSEAFT
jgi:hypothetical protein